MYRGVCYLAEEDVFWLEVPVDDLVLVHVPESLDDLLDILTS